MQEQKQVPVPTALKELISSNNLLLDGWKLDMETMMYIKQEHDTSIG